MLNQCSRVRVLNAGLTVQYLRFFMILPGEAFPSNSFEACHLPIKVLARVPIALDCRPEEKPGESLQKERRLSSLSFASLSSWHARRWFASTGKFFFPGFGAALCQEASDGQVGGPWPRVFEKRKGPGGGGSGRTSATSPSSVGPPEIGEWSVRAIALSRPAAGAVRCPSVSAGKASHAITTGRCLCASRFCVVGEAPFNSLPLKTCHSGQPEGIPLFLPFEPPRCDRDFLIELSSKANCQFAN